MIYLGKNAVGISDTVQVVSEDIVNRVNAVEIKEKVSTPSNVLTIYDGADNVPVDELVVGIEPLQDLHGYDSPWPGGGGKNLFNWQDTSKTYEMWPGNDVLNMQSNTRSLALPCEPNTSYTISKSVANVVFVGCWIKEAPAQDVAVFGRVQVTTNSLTITTGEDAAYIVCWYYNNAQGNETLTPEQIAQTIQIETGSTATAYAPYENVCPISGWTGANIYHSGEDMTDPETISVSFPTEAGTIYGSELNVATGVITVTNVAQVFTGEENWAINQAANFYIRTDYSGQATKIQCSHFPSNTMTATGTAGNCYISGTGYLNLQTTAIEHTSSAMKAYCSEQYANNTPFMIVFPLESPQTYQLTPAQITTLLGTNHIWADTGDILSLTYSADPKMYVDQNKGVSDVQVNGTSVVTDGVANVPLASNNTIQPGVVRPWIAGGITILDDGRLYVSATDIQYIKTANEIRKPIVPSQLHAAVFFGLSRAAGVDLKDIPVSQINPAIPSTYKYPEDSKSAISQMLNAPVTVSGTTPSITALPGVRYICGECSTLSVTVPESGIIDVTFTSGSTATVLTVTPPTGKNMRWANGFDPTTLDADTVYEINIMDGCYGVVGSWT